ncbi:thiamine pyrophosphokinase [Aphelenchoides avenae]|nr:thiamine pyrophosphokinase [Aphelenchus avenae]
MASQYKPFDYFAHPETSAVLWVNGTKAPPTELWTSTWNKALLRYCTDGAANTLMPLCGDKKTSNPHVIAGDFDSIKPATKAYFEGRSRLIETPSQDATDLTKTLGLIHETEEHKNTKLSSVFVLGGISGRFDHTLGAINSLLKHRNASAVPIVAVDGENIVTVLKEGTTEIELDLSKLTRVCGLVPFCQRPTKVSTTGFRWNLEDAVMEFGGLISTSNEIVANCLTVTTTAPLIFTVEVMQQ